MIDGTPFTYVPDSGNDTVSGDVSPQSEYVSVFRQADRCITRDTCTDRRKHDRKNVLRVFQYHCKSNVGEKLAAQIGLYWDIVCDTQRAKQ